MLCERCAREDGAGAGPNGTEDVKRKIFYSEGVVERVKILNGNGNKVTTERIIGQVWGGGGGSKIFTSQRS